jgi:hypothetical protein
VVVVFLRIVGTGDGETIKAALHEQSRDVKKTLNFFSRAQQIGITTQKTG